ncbi:MAG: hypothetical protein ACRELD_16365, partial [Longimicrobiales bacterium]
MSPSNLSALHRAVIREAEREPRVRKLLVCRARGEGRELLRGIAVHGHGWIGFEATTPRPLALELVGDLLAERDLTPLDAFAEQALIDDALDDALARGRTTFTALADGLGFRDAVADTIAALRSAAITPARLQQAAFTDQAKRELLVAVLERYLERLERTRRIDSAGIFELAAAALQDGAVRPPRARLYLMPELSRRGLRGRFLRRLEAHGAAVLESDPVLGLEAPAALTWAAGVAEAPLSWLNASQPGDAPAAGAALRLDVFAAASPTDELREVLRRIMAAGWHWDEVEIVAADPAIYGGALHALSERLGAIDGAGHWRPIPCSFGVGLPVERTRPGRALAAYLRWLESGFPATVLRELLDAGDITAGEGAP